MTDANPGNTATSRHETARAHPEPTGAGHAVLKTKITFPGEKPGETRIRVYPGGIRTGRYPDRSDRKTPPAPAAAVQASLFDTEDR